MIQFQTTQRNKRKNIIKYKPLEVTHENDNINAKKVSDFDEISPRMLKNFPKKAIILLTDLYNSI